MDSKLHILFLGTEWGSSQDDLSTLNRELSKHFAKCPKIGRVSFLVPPGKAVQAKGEALNYSVHLVEATYCPGMDTVQSLSFPPDSLGNIDVVIGCGLQFGPHAKRIKDMKQCILVQFVHESSEELGMFRGIPEYEEKHEREIELCKMADLVVALGPKLGDTITAQLCSETTVMELIPGIFEQFAKLTPAEKGRRMNRIFLFGDTDLRDFELKGFDVAAKAIGSMHQMKYDLIFVGAPEGKQDEVKKLLLQEGITTKQLTVRSLCESQERLSRMFLEADLCIMPSRTEGFGLTALKAMSAGTPILVSGNSGFGQALLQVDFGSSCIVDSDEPEVWRRKMEDVLEKERSQRLKEAARIRDAYSAKHSWKEECNTVVESICRVKLQDVDKEHYVPFLQGFTMGGSSRPSGLNQTATDKIALVIGNRDYMHLLAEEQPLIHTCNDAKQLASMLCKPKMGFKVISLINLTKSEMEKAVEIFCSLLGEGVYGLVYFAGHGFEQDGQNYLVPIDTGGEWTPQQAVCVQKILEQMVGTNVELNVFLLDVCRKGACAEKPFLVETYQFPCNAEVVFGFATCPQAEAFEKRSDPNGFYMKQLLVHIMNEEKVEDLLHKVSGAVADDIKLQEYMDLPMRPQYQSTTTRAYSLRDPIVNDEHSDQRRSSWLDIHKLPQKRTMEHDHGVTVEMRFEHKNWLSNVIVLCLHVVNVGSTKFCDATLKLEDLLLDVQKYHFHETAANVLRQVVRNDDIVGRSWPSKMDEPTPSPVERISEIYNIQRLKHPTLTLIIEVKFAINGEAEGQQTTQTRYTVMELNSKEFGIANALKIPKEI